MSKKKHVRSSDDVSNCFGAALGLRGGRDFRRSPGNAHVAHTFVFYFEHFPHPIPISKLITFHPITHQQNAAHSPFDFRQGRLPFCGALFYSENQPTSSYALDKPRLRTSATSSVSSSKTSLSTPPLSWRRCGPIGPIAPLENLGWPLHWGTTIPQRSTPRSTSKCRLFRREGTDNFGWGDQFPMYIGQYHFPPFSTFDNGIPAVFQRWCTQRFHLFSCLSLPLSSFFHFSRLVYCTYIWGVLSMNREPDCFFQQSAFRVHGPA